MTVQELILKYWKTSYNKTEIYENILKEIFKLDKLYILVNPKSSDVSTDKLEPYINEDGSGELIIYVFSEESIAKQLANRYQFVKEGKELIAPITVSELIVIIKKSMYMGLESIIVDEGANFFKEHTSKILKSYYEYIGEQILYEEDKFKMLRVLNNIYRKDCNVYVIPNQDTKMIDFIDKNVIPVIEETNNKRIIKLFLLKSDAENYGRYNGYVSKNSTPYNIELNRYNINDLTINLYNDIDEVHIVILNNTYKISVIDLLKFIEDISFKSIR